MKIIMYKKFQGGNITDSTKEAVYWATKKNIKIIAMFEYRVLFYHGGVMVIYEK